MAEKDKGTAGVTEEKSPVKAKETKEKVKLSVRIKKFFKDYKSEIKKITWPNRDYVVKNTGIVVAAIVAIAVIVGVLDLSFTAGLQFLADII